MSSATSDQQLQAIWAEAFDTYRNRTGRDIETDSELEGLYDVDDVLRKLERSEKRFSDYRAQHPQFWKTVSFVSKPVILIGYTVLPQSDTAIRLIVWP